MGYAIIEACSAGPFLELFARGTRPGWAYWGNQADDSYAPTWKTYAHNSHSEKTTKNRRIKSQREQETLELALD